MKLIPASELKQNASMIAIGKLAERFVHNDVASRIFMAAANGDTDVTMRMHKDAYLVEFSVFCECVKKLLVDLGYTCEIEREEDDGDPFGDPLEMLLVVSW